MTELAKRLLELAEHPELAAHNTDALREAAAALSGVRVPVEPTEEMVNEGALGIATDSRGYAPGDTTDSAQCGTWRRDARAAYKAMVKLAAAKGER